MPHKNLGLRILIARKEEGISQSQLARKLATSNSLVNHWENNKHRPNRRSLKKLAKILKRPVAYFREEGYTHQTAEPHAAYAPEKNAMRLPILASLPPSFPKWEEDDTVGFIDFPRFLFPRAALVLRIAEGDLCILSADNQPIAGKLFLIKTRNALLLKTVKTVGRRAVKLEDPQDLKEGNYKIVGRVLGIIKNTD